MKKKLAKIFRFTLLVGVLVAAIHLISMLTFDRSIAYPQVTFSHPKVSDQLKGYRIAFITDSHKITGQELEKVVAKLNEQELDLLVLGGDFAEKRDPLWQSLEAFSRVDTTDGIYGVPGNHDHQEQLFFAMDYYGIHPLSNSGVAIAEGFYLAGVEDLWMGKPDIAAATAGAKPDDFVLLLAHNPDTTMEQNTCSAHLVLSGHTHGGQISLFGLWKPALTTSRVITDYRSRFGGGFAKSTDGTPVFVSRGTGQFGDVPRVFARPEVVIFTLAAEKQAIDIP